MEYTFNMLHSNRLDVSYQGTEGLLEGDMTFTLNMVYDTSVDISYQGIQNVLEGDELYRAQFLKAFGMDTPRANQFGPNTFSEDRWRIVIDDLMPRLEHIPACIQLMDHVGKEIRIPYQPEKKREYHELCVMMLFSYTYFEQFHKVLRDLDHGRLSSDSTESTSPALSSLLSVLGSESNASNEE